jgi:hypothetical protein
MKTILKPETDIQKDFTSQPSEEESNAYIMLAKKSLQQKLLLTQKAIETSPKFAALRTSPINSVNVETQGSVILAAQFAITSAFIHSWIYTNTPLHFPGQDLRFEADVWGIGLGGGVVWLSGWLDSADNIFGDVHFELRTSITITEIAFAKGIKPVGVLVGGGLNVQAGFFAGTGTFKNW